MATLTMHTPAVANMGLVRAKVGDFESINVTGAIASDRVDVRTAAEKAATAAVANRAHATTLLVETTSELKGKMTAGAGLDLTGALELDSAGSAQAFLINSGGNRITSTGVTTPSSKQYQVADDGNAYLKSIHSKGDVLATAGIYAGSKVEVATAGSAVSSTHGFSATTAGEVSGTRLDLRTMRDSDGVAFNPNDTPTGSVPIDLLSDSLWIGKGGTQPKFMVDNVGVDVGSSTQYNGGTMIPFNAYGDARVWRDLTVTRDAVVTGNLTVNGTTTTVSSTTVTLADKLITYNKHSTPSDDPAYAGAAGSGFEVDVGRSTGTTNDAPRPTIKYATQTGTNFASNSDVSAFELSEDLILPVKTVSKRTDLHSATSAGAKFDTSPQLTTSVNGVTKNTRSQAMHFGDMSAAHWIIVADLVSDKLQFWWGTYIPDNALDFDAAGAKLAFEINKPL